MAQSNGQGGFDERLDEILEHLLIDYDFDVKDKDSRTFDRAKQAIRTLVLEEIIGQDRYQALPNSYTDEERCRFYRDGGYNFAKAEQRKKLGGSDGKS